MAIADAIGTIISLLSADTDISALVGARVFGAELPPAEAASMPRKAIVVTAAGGIDAADFAPWQRPRFDLKCYGETPGEADLVRRTAHAVLKQAERGSVGGTLMFSCTQSAGPTQFRDPDFDWPISMETWLAEMQE